MSQRIRASTTGAAAPPPAEHAPTIKREHSPTKAGKRSRPREAPVIEAEGQALHVSQRSADAAEPHAALGTDELARALHAVAAELERDPALARRVAAAVRGSAPPVTDVPRAPGAGNPPPAARDTVRGFRPRVIEGASPALGPGIPDPFALRARLGEDGLRQALLDLRLGSLRAIVREHRLDPDGAAVRGNDVERLRALILERTRAQ